MLRTLKIAAISMATLALLFTGSVGMESFANSDVVPDMGRPLAFANNDVVPDMGRPLA